MRGSRVLPCALIAALACGEEMTTPIDATDAGRADIGQPSLPDAGVAITDTGPRPDTGPRDAGFEDPDTLLAGVYDLNGLRTYLKLLGTQTSTMPPAIVLHSGPAISHEYLLPHMKAIQRGRLLVFYDMRAHGRTSFGTLSNSSTITMGQHVLDLTDVVDFVAGFVERATPVDLIGHGYGAAIAALWAADNPDRVSRLILTTPYPVKNAYLSAKKGEESRRLTGPQRVLLMRLMRAECLQDLSACALQIWGIYGPNTMCEDKRDLFDQMTFLYGTPRAAIFVENELINSNYDLTPALARITAPTTIISGDCDTTPVESALVWTSSIAGAIHHALPDSGHFPMVETSTTYFSLLRSALIYP